MAKPAVGHVRSRSETSIAKLARFFRDATPVRIPVRLTQVLDQGQSSEDTVIEYGTPREVLFTSHLPLQFADRLRVQNSDGSLNVEASVVALQHNGGRTAFAARFAQEVGNWIVKP